MNHTQRHTKMGSGSSILKCPKGYDKEKFKQICSLFDKLDQDSNMGVSSDEMTQIAALHVENCQKRLQERINAMRNGKVRALEKLAHKHLHEQRALQKQQEAQMQELADRVEYEIQHVQRTLYTYASLDDAGKADTFMRVVGKGSHIDFWTFFEYMKTRTDDIKNITL